MVKRYFRAWRNQLSALSVFFYVAINGIIYSLKGLRMYTNQLVRWHLINMGSPKDVHSVYFHGQTFQDVKTKRYRQAVFPLLPGEKQISSSTCSCKEHPCCVCNTLLDFCRGLCNSGDVSIQAWAVAAGDGSWSKPKEGDADTLPDSR